MSSKRYFALFSILGLIALVWLALSGPRKPAELKVRGQSIEAWSLKALAGDTNAVAVIRETGARAVPNLVWQLRTRDTFLRVKLWRYQSRFPRRVQLLIQEKFPWPNSVQGQEAAALSLGIIGAPAKEAVPELVKCLGNHEMNVAWKAALALARIGKDSVTLLTKELSNKNGSVRCFAACALGQIGPDAVPAIHSLIRNARDADEQVRSASIQSLSQLGTPALLALVEEEQNGPEESRKAVDKILTEFDRLNQKSVTSKLTDLTKDNSPDIRRRAIEGLGATRASNLLTKTVLIDCLEDGDPAVRLTTINVLGSMGVKARAAKSALAKMTEEQDETLRNAAKEALSKIQSSEPGPRAQAYVLPP